MQRRSSHAFGRGFGPICGNWKGFEVEMPIWAVFKQLPSTDGKNRACIGWIFDLEIYMAETLIEASVGKLDTDSWLIASRCIKHPTNLNITCLFEKCAF